MMPTNSPRLPSGNLADDEAGVTILRPHWVGLPLVFGENGEGPGKRGGKDAEANEREHTIASESRSILHDVGPQAIEPSA